VTNPDPFPVREGLAAAAAGRRLREVERLMNFSCAKKGWKQTVGRHPAHRLILHKPSAMREKRAGNEM
jgi:hypothetical protein